MRDLQIGVHWAQAGNRGEKVAGNGAAMRIVPLAFFLNPEYEADRRTIRDICRITHHNDEAYVGALAIVYAIRAAITGTWQAGDELLEQVANELPDTV